MIRQELTVGGGHASGQMGWMHFGLGEATAVKARVQWPSGEWSPWQAVPADSFSIWNKGSGLDRWSAP